MVRQIILHARQKRDCNLWINQKMRKRNLIASFGIGFEQLFKAAKELSIVVRWPNKHAQQ